MLKSSSGVYDKSFMMDAVIYGNKKGDKDASSRYGVSVSRIQCWRQEFPELPAKPKFEFMESPTETTKNTPTTSRRVFGKQDEHDKILADWTINKMNDDCFPTQAQLGKQATELGLKNSLRSPKGVRSFLHRTDLYERWNVGAKQRGRNRNTPDYKKLSSDTNPSIACSLKKSKPKSNIKWLEKIVAGWVTKELNFHRRPTQPDIGKKWLEMAKQHGIEVHYYKTWPRKFLIRHRLLAKWREELHKSSIVPLQVMEDKLFQWLRAEYPNNQHPRRQLIFSKVYEITKELNITDFKPTVYWHRNFLRRYFINVKHQVVESVSSSCEDEAAIESGHLENDTGADAAPSCSYSTGRSDGDDDDDHDATIEFSNGIASDSPEQVDEFTEEPCNSVKGSFQLLDPAKQMESDSNTNRGNLMHQSSETRMENFSPGRHVIKRSFGSFHSSNFDEQLRFAESASYMPVELPVRPPMFYEYTISNCKFGSTIRKKHFFLEQGCVFLNHGAFGATLKEALDYYHDWQRHVESQPLRFFDRHLFPQIVHVQKRLADFIGCKASEITFITNVTTAINAVLQGLQLNEGSSIYYLNLTYGAVKKIIKHVCTRTGANAIEEEVTLPLSKPEDIVSLVRSTLKNTTTLAIFDHVPSNYAFIMPIRELVSVCHQRGVQVLIDGAHGLGQLDLDLSTLGADYYMGNCHKWFCSPKGCAFMYVNKQLQRLTRGLIISHGYDEGFHSQFVFTGAKDYCSYLSLHALINFWTTVGPNNIREYCKSLLKDVAEYFMSKWDVELLAPIENHGMMCCVSLPSVLFSGKDVSYNDAEAIQNRLYSDFNIEVPIKCIDNKLYVRISAHIYNEFSEYATLASAILQIANAS